MPRLVLYLVRFVAEEDDEQFFHFDKPDLADDGHIRVIRQIALTEQSLLLAKSLIDLAKALKSQEERTALQNLLEEVWNDGRLHPVTT